MKADTILLMCTNFIFLPINIAVSAAKFNWTNGMVDVFFCAHFYNLKVLRSISDQSFP